MKAFLIALVALLVGFAAHASDVKLVDLRGVKVSSEAEFTSYVPYGDDLRGNGSVSALDSNVSPMCSLTGSNVDLSNFKEVSRDYPGGEGTRFQVNAKNSINLKFANSLSGVEYIEASCNGEPELCEGQSGSYYYRTQILLTDSAGKSWNLNCLAPFSRSLKASDVTIQGLEIK